MSIHLNEFKRPGDFRSLLCRAIWGAVQASLFRHSPTFLWFWRRFLLRLFGAKIGKGVKISPTCSVLYPHNLSIGDYCWIGPYDELYCSDRLVIGNNVALAQHVRLYTASHDIEDPSFRTITAPIIIKDQAWLAVDTFVGRGVTIGEGVVLGARSSAFKDLPAWSICLGTPARPVRKRVLRDS